MRGVIICLLVFGLTHAEEDNIGDETKDIGSKASGASVNFRFYDKNKRGATKITNTDNPSFNHLGTSNTVSSSNSGGFKPSTIANANPPPFRYLYNQQYYQPNPYLTYVQIPQAAQIAAQYATQYAIQPSPVGHFFQTPNQIQYVSTPTVAQVPQIKFQSFSNDYSSANSATSESSTSSGTGSSYAPQTQQTGGSSQIYTSSSASSAGSGASATVSQAKQIQVPFYQGYQSVQPLFFQQPLLTYFPQTAATNFIYQQPNANYFLKHQQQQLASIYGANRFGLYSQTPNTQLTYLVPMVVSQPEQDSTSTTSNLKSSDKSVSNVQQSSTTSSFTYGTKA